MQENLLNTKLERFKKAINPKVNNFREFPKYLNKLNNKKTTCNVLYGRNSL